jgi:methyltransferase (TIGR00027 family)
MTNNDATLAGKLKAMQENDSRAQEILGITPAKFAWIGKAFAHARTTLFAKYLSKDETKEILRRQLEHANHMDAWPRLMVKIRTQMEVDSPIESDAVQDLMIEWKQLFRDSYCSDNIEMGSKVRQAFMSEPDLMIGVGVDESLMSYAQKAMMHSNRPQQTMFNTGPKPSAHMVAVQRAVHQLVDHPLLFEDALALRILGPTNEKALRESISQFQDPMNRGLRTSLVVRSRLAEDELAKAIDSGVRQVVILGAGLDTLAYRNRGNQVRFFEVDLPETQTWKRQCLAAANIVALNNVTFVPIDFQTSTLAQGLAEAGFIANNATFFIWLGVVMYLDEVAIKEPLRFISNCSSGSAVILDYVVPTSSLPPVMRAPIDVMMKYVAGQREPWKSFYEPHILAAELNQLGFRAVYNFTPQELNQRYLSDRIDGLQLNGLTRLMVATVSS